MEMDKIGQLRQVLSIYCDNDTISTFFDKIESNPLRGFVSDKTSKITDYFEENSMLKPSLFDNSYFYYSGEESKPGNSLLHHAGFFYMMDASSAYVTERLASLLGKGALVIDLCAAPGGKSISLKLRRKDIDLLANDISQERAKEMNRNIERMGLDIKTLSMDPSKMDLPSLFDAVILDAPCSGSGMLRKERKMLEDWSPKKVERLLPIQENLLEKAYSLLSPSGILCYATCSLSYEEDDLQVRKFLSRHPDMAEIQVPVEKSVLRKDFGYHLLPGIFPGEGIYFAFLKKKGERQGSLPDRKTKEKSPVEGYLAYRYRDNLYLTKNLPAALPSLPYLRPGFRVFDTSDHPKCPYDNGYAKIATSFPIQELTKKEAIDYFAGLEIQTDSKGKDGLYVLSYLDVPLGFAKKVKNRFKNYLPKGLRAKVF